MVPSHIGDSTSLLESQAEVETLLGNGVQDINPDDVERILWELREDIQTLSKELGFLMPLAPYFSWVPEIGPLIAVSPE